jgi:hypothetical protein
MDRTPKVVALSDRLRNAWRAFKGDKVGSLHFGIEVKRCDQCDKVRAPNVLYLCDSKYCEGGCSNDACKHTLDINHAVNFMKHEGHNGPYFVEIEEDER